MNSAYWPEESEVRRCIKTEAEELSDAVLMAVHEPMKMTRVPAGAAAGEPVDERALLEHVLATNRPTPILGQSGFGKSHVIRWLDVNLRRRNKRGDWHIIRIPKNASLKQALIILLQDLEGPQFEQARKKIASVGRELNTRTVAQHLVVFVGARLEELLKEAEVQWRAAQELGHELSDDDSRRIRKIRKHAKRNGLAALINDPYFNKQLIDEGRSFHQIAKRFTEGSTDQEIEDNVFQVTATDLELEAELGDLSLDARTYIRNSRLNTSEESLEDAVGLLNECLNDACREAFQQLFHFDSGSFQDLFQEIRASLKESGKTLFILVEDMATISAIEDVLIDSLMQEDVRDGRQILCPLHSAIAVTSGYHGYARRRETLITRAKYEWEIRRSAGTAEETYSRIENFCGRYLNAARIGEGTLAAEFSNNSKQECWPDVWESGDKAEADLAEVFGKSSKGFPLFPYNKHAIRALANRYLKPHETVEFNPRKILQHILREPLEHFRKAYVKQQFPPPDFAGMRCPGSLINELEFAVREDKERSYSLAAVWGFGAQSLSELAYQLPPDIPREFSLDTFANVIENTKPSEPSRQVATGPGQTTPKPPPGDHPLKDQPTADPHAIDREVDQYFEKESIPQPAANAIRQALVREYDAAQKDYRDWYGMGEWPNLGQRIPPIFIPFNRNNPAQPLLAFGTEKEFRDPSQSQRYKRFIVAVLRRNSEPSNVGNPWASSEGLQDYCHYKNFLDQWMPEAVLQLVDLERDKAKVLLLERLQEAAVVSPRISTARIAAKVDELILTSEQVRAKVNVDTGLNEWDQFISQHLEGWDSRQKAWINAFSTNRHGIEGDLLQSALRGRSEVAFPPRALRAAQKARDEFMRRFPEFGLLQSCASFEEFSRVFKKLDDLVSKLNASQQFSAMEDITTARKYKNKIAKVLSDDDWLPIKGALALQEPFAPIDTILALHSFDSKKIEIVVDCLSIWKVFVERNLTRLRNDNAEHGADKRKIAEDEFQQLLGKVGAKLQRHRCASHDEVG